ncbi:tetratricopeptide repeat protein [Mycobacterium kyogaense]|uniref:tetratricopeptide repeat protein n=1 Tax=Mycobacterium kyogaense TaxID=2212479 RepID=UPI000DACD58B|nr:tetratricopeptide repeat protein [Mycobacterium kyogaense]
MADDAPPPEGEVTETAPDTSVEPTDTDSADTDSADTDGADTDENADARPPREPWSSVKIALVGGLAGVVALAGLTGWLGFRTWESQRAEQAHELFLQVGRQGALNLTTIDWQEADADVQRILDSATGTFYDDFQKRAQAFADVVKQAKSKSEGTIAEAGLESSTDNEAEVLVAVNVKTTNAGAPEQQPRAWRMRISVEKIGDEAKVSNVEFVP